MGLASDITAKAGREVCNLLIYLLLHLRFLLSGCDGRHISGHLGQSDEPALYVINITKK